MNVETPQKTPPQIAKERRHRFLSKSGLMLLGALMLLGVGLFAGCESAGAGNGDSNGGTTEPADPTEEDFSAAVEPLENADPGDGGGDGSAVSSAGEEDPATDRDTNTEITGDWVVEIAQGAMRTYSTFAKLIEQWDGRDSFSYEDEDGNTVSVTLEEGEDLWRLTAEPDDTYIYEMKRESDRWTYSLEKSNASTVTVFEGELVFGAREGSFTVYSGESGSEKTWTVEWNPAEDPYHTAYTAQGDDDGSVTVEVTVTTTRDGTSGEWSYDKGDIKESGDW